MMAVRLTARPSFDHLGRRRPDCFDVFLDESPEPLLSSRQPLLDACCVLLARGFEPTLTVVMSHSESDVVSLRSKLSVGRLTVMGRRLVPRRDGATRMADLQGGVADARGGHHHGTDEIRCTRPRYTSGGPK